MGFETARGDVAEFAVRRRVVPWVEVSREEARCFFYLQWLMLTTVFGVGISTGVVVGVRGEGGKETPFCSRVKPGALTAMIVDTGFMSGTYKQAKIG